MRRSTQGEISTLVLGNGVLLPSRRSSRLPSASPPPELLPTVGLQQTAPRRTHNQHDAYPFVFVSRKAAAPMVMRLGGMCSTVVRWW